MRDQHFLPATDRPNPSDAIRDEQRRVGFAIFAVAAFALFVALPGAYAIAMKAKENAQNVRIAHAPV